MTYEADAQADNLMLVDRARRFATEHHVFINRQLYRDLPYTHHLVEVVRVLQAHGYGMNNLLIAAAWLHDVVEDCPEVTMNVLHAEFGITHSIDSTLPAKIGTMLRIIDAVTNQPGANRAAKHAATYPRIRKIPQAIILKLADRIANTQASSAGQPILQMYQKEYPTFKTALWSAGVGTSLWATLDIITQGIGL